MEDPAIGQFLSNLPYHLHELGRGPSLALEMTCVRERRFRSGPRAINRIFPKNLQTALRETIVSGGFEELGKKQRQRADCARVR